MTPTDMAEAYRVPILNRLARTLLRPVFRGLFNLLSRVEIEGRENVPPSGAYLIVINHISLYEPPFILAFWPVAPEAAGAVDIWSRPGQALLVRLYGGIPVHRGQYDRRLLESMLAVLRSGKPLLIAPEGGRSHTPGMQRALPGVAYVASQAQVPILPVGLTGTTDDFLQRALHGERPRLGLRIGAPFRLPPLPLNAGAAERHTARQRSADLIMARIADLLPPEYQGVYARRSAAETAQPESSP